MRIVLISLILFIQNPAVHAQSYQFSDTAYYDRNFKRIKDIKDAFYYRPPVIKNDRRYYIQYHFVSDNVLFLSGSFLPVEKDFKLSLDFNDAIKDGFFVFYDGRDTSGYGEYRNDEQVGEWKMFNKGRLIKQAFCKEKITYIIDYRKNGTRKKEGWLEDVKGSEYNVRQIGEWSFYNADGKTLSARGNFKRGEIHGLSTFFDTLGNIMYTGNYKHNKKDGLWKYYYPFSNKLRKEMVYSKGVLSGAYKLYDSITGRIIEEGKYKKGYQSGNWKFYAANSGAVIGEAKFYKDKGEVVYYDESSGLPKLSGTIFQNKRIGEWTNFYVGTTKKQWVGNYEDGLLHGLQFRYDTLGFMRSSMTFRDGLREGLSKFYFDYSNKLWIEASYHLDTVDGVIKIYYRNGRKKRNAVFSHGYMISDSCFNLAGDVIACEPIYEHAKSHVNVMTYIGDNLRYPEEARTEGIQGKTIIGFYIDETGKVINPEIVRGFNNYCDEEALRLIKSMPDWIPAKMDGTPFISYVRVPVVFWLPNEAQD